MRRLAFLFALLISASAHATCSAVPNTFSAGTTIASSQVNANFTAAVNCINAIDGGQITGGTISASRLPAPLSFLARQVFTGSGTYTPTAAANVADVTCVGGGGGGGGAAATNAAQMAVAGGGGSGALAKKRIASPTAQTVTIGAGGTAGTAVPSAGGTGGTTTFGAILSAGGGTGGGAGVAAGVGGGIAGGAAGTASGGDLNMSGQIGGYASYMSIAAILTGPGAPSPLGFGMGGPSLAGATVGGGTGNGSGFGAGASGAGNQANQFAIAGSQGTAGICVVDEYR